MNLIGEHQDVEELLQKALLALDFWLPSVPENGLPKEMFDRICHDAELLIYRDGDMIRDAETLGWVKLTAPTSSEVSK